MSQLSEIEYIVVKHTSSDSRAGALFLDIIQALGWEIDGVDTVQGAIEYLNREQ